MANRIHIKLLLIITLLFITGCEQSSIDSDALEHADKTGAKTELDKQLKINKDALYKGSDEQIRIDAATVMLFHPAYPAREILLDALKQTENKVARVAVCKALIQTRTEQKSVKNKEDFIQPLCDILETETDFTSRLAAESILIFEYDQISKPLEKIVSDRSLPIKSRLNAIYALRLQPDMKAVFKLIELLDDPEGQVATEAEKALRSLGTPVGKDAKARKQIRSEIKRKGRDRFFRDLLIRQEGHMRTLETERNFWQKQYIVSLNKMYESISKDEEKGKFLAEQLKSQETTVKLWSLEKVYQSRVGTTSKLPPELGPILISLISDNNREVRLKTAKLLSLMGQLNSAQHLVNQIEIEHDDEVKTELFVALGGVCHYAFSPNADFKVPNKIRQKTLEWAVEYLSEKDPQKARKGAEVIKKLLEQNGLTPERVDRYLGLLVDKYKQLVKNSTNGPLRGELISAMAGLCAQSVYKNDASKLFKPIFEKAMDDATDLVREAATDGLCYIDKTMALTKLREKMVNDSSPIIRKKLIELAGDVGGQHDLYWLAKKIGSSTEDELAWQTMLTIYRRSDFSIIMDWLNKFEANNEGIVLSGNQMISFLEITEQKSISENKHETLKSIREKLAKLYYETGQFEQAAKYYGMLREVATTAEEKEKILDSLLNVYLSWNNIELATRLIANRLLEKDLEPDSVSILMIDNYLKKPTAGADPKLILEAFSEIKIANRPIWYEHIQKWQERFSHSETPEKSQKSL